MENHKIKSVKLEGKIGSIEFEPSNIVTIDFSDDILHILFRAIQEIESQIKYKTQVREGLKKLNDEKQTGQNS